jgi:uncharacterized protein (TIGR02679 family)
LSRTEVPPGVAEWTRKAGPAMLLDAVRRRAQQGYRTEKGTLRLDLTETHRREIGLMLGTRWEVSGRQPRLQDLAARLAEHGLSVRGLIEALDGHEITDQRAERARTLEAARAERDAAVGVLVDCGFAEPDVRAWLAETRLAVPGGGALRAQVEQVARTWHALPGGRAQPVRLARLAADLWQDAHSLDADTSLGRAVARLAATANRVERPIRAGRAWRAAWASVGVWCDGVSSRVLGLNLPLAGESAAAKLCASTPGEPVWLTLRTLANPWQVAGTPTVFVCENPTVIEAIADNHGAASPPVVCTDGVPSGAALDLLDGLAQAGCTIRLRADVDQNGLVTVEQVRRVAPSARLWRYDVHTYLVGIGKPPPPMHERDSDTEFGELRRTFEQYGIALHEETILEELLGDLTTAHRD